MIMKVKLCCLLRLLKSCAQKLLILKDFNLMAAFLLAASFPFGSFPDGSFPLAGFQFDGRYSSNYYRQIPSPTIIMPKCQYLNCFRCRKELTLYEHLGREKSLALPVFHSFTGCDTTFAFYGRGKKSAWEAWNCFDDIT